MKQIWKYPLRPDREGRVLLDLPHVREPLAVGWQESEGSIVAWFAVDPEGGFEFRTFEVAGTGFSRPEGEYRGTVQAPHGLVWHVFERAAEGSEATP